ncbi:MAG: hypothetical protein QF790_09170 [Gammaproteobacteria bacterium]|jgi:hypothetical protein|nr:hypothetical protein [Gammaproteobacteria bacterium]MDP6617319.1 hypothetical protein [Gammaproteobacteria bacterium]MDP6694097.1 hypothetical protein [Gammaproteobacteria bacterium]
MDTEHKNRLLVLHRLKNAAGQGLDASSLRSMRASGFALDTCLRQLLVMVAPDFPVELPGADLAQRLSGRHAYSFLLQTATGLNSSIPGESNILGQFRGGWNRWRADADAESVCGLTSYMHRLFRDSRHIRREYLQGIGGSSYGSLVRKLLQPDQHARILFIGQGKLARSVHPLFRDYVTAFWNHRDSGANPEPATLRFAPDAAANAADWATHMIITTPADSENDGIWAKLAGQQVRHVVHLGRRRAAQGIWSDPEHGFAFSNLDDIFDLRRTQSSLRSAQITRARRACERIAAGQETFAPDRSLAGALVQGA